MTEKLLQFIWQFKYFNSAELLLESEERCQIINPGILNRNQGPDFLDARIRIDDTVWVGNIEIHLKASDWKKHAHSRDLNFKNVILHVVLENDLNDATNSIPTLVLGHRIPKLLLEKYESWMQSQAFIPCAGHLASIHEATWNGRKEKLTLERLQRRTQSIRDSLLGNLTHWEELFWWMIAANFGLKVNAAAFEAIARTLPQPLLARHKNRRDRVEALLMGQAGLLEKKFSDEYPSWMKKEYEFFRLKYQLKPVYHRMHFLRMRPINFPTIRLSQLAALICRSSHLFSQIKETESLVQVRSWLKVRAHDYWNDHYLMDEVSPYSMKALGGQMIDNLVINTIVPILFAYGSMNKEDKLKRRAVAWLEDIDAEKNSVIAGWQEMGIVVKHAADSQGLLELKTYYCDKKKCLECAIGKKLLNNRT